MRLLRVSLHDVGPFDDAVLRLATPEPAEDADAPPAESDEIAPVSAAPPRPVTVLFGGDGTGKTSLVSALALTRPGHALPPLPSAASSGTRARGGGARTAPYVATEWLLGDDDPERPHPLVVASPSAVFAGESADAAAIRRREQALFDRRAQQDGGFVFVSFSGSRWFSRVPNMLSVPERSILRYDVRQPNASFDDPTRADLTRETKQAISYASIGAALGADRAEYHHLGRFEAALREVIDVVLEPFDLSHAGVSPTSLEPLARSARGGLVPFDAMPRAARHLVSFVTLPLRALFAAYPNADAPREREGVVAIDDVEAQQDPALLRELVPLLRRALPNVQWLLTTASTHLALACEAPSVVALRRTEASRVELGEGLLH
ncbi:MAG: ATP-binding protein [Labilithrix sp.]|nr:ATP-binding protein [Labilithrix sp.]MBX3223067.1 ATP-binding protein [Labilithrix sp.]